MSSLLSCLPYRVRVRLDRGRIRRAIGGLDKTRAYAAAAPEEADAEVHMLVCRRDAELGLLALKSLLRFKGVRWAVSLSDDRSLTPTLRRWFDRHIPGCRWLNWPTPDQAVEAALQHRPALRALYHQSSFPLVCKIVHPMVLARSRRVVLLDPDTAFFERPQRLLAWARGQDQRPLYMHDHQNEAANVPDETRQLFADFTAACAPASRRWRMDYWFFNSGCLAFRPDQLDLDLAEKFLAWRAAAPLALREGKTKIWMGEWTLEQTCYQVMFALADPPAAPLGDDYHLGGDLGHTFNHFLRHYLVRPQSLDALRGLVAQL